MALTLDSTIVRIPLQRLPIAAAALDRLGAIMSANQQFVRLCGSAASTAPRRRLADIVAEPDRPAVEEAFNQLIFQDGRLHRGARIEARRAKRPSVRIAIEVVGLGSGSSVPYVACLQTIPASRRPDSAPHGRLQERGHRTRSSRLEPFSVDIESQPSLITLSHELRGPLAAIRGWAAMAESGGLPPEKLSRALTLIGRNAASLSDLIDRLFEMSHRTVGVKRDRQLLDLNPLTQLVVESTLPAAGARNVMLTVAPSRSPLQVNGDRLGLEEVVRNLVHNAVKFTPSGGHVHVHTESDGSFAELVVSDTGLGIAPDLLPVIFEPFRHDVATVSAAERGLGLGLALVRELVQLHDGSVRALSGGKGLGSTFIVRLPMARAATV
jgi:signal transduction histidine kinase